MHICIIVLVLVLELNISKLDLLRQILAHHLLVLRNLQSLLGRG